MSTTSPSSKAKNGKRKAKTTRRRRASGSGKTAASRSGDKAQQRPQQAPPTAVKDPEDIHIAVADTPSTDAPEVAAESEAQAELSGLFQPVVQGAQHARTSDVRTVQNDYEEGRLRMADLQRCADQWDPRMESLLIESIVANYPIPPITIWPEPHKTGPVDLVLDGQQRLSTILSFIHDGFACLPTHKAPYDGYRIAQYIADRRFSELTPDVQKHILSYKLSFCVLPESLKTEDRLRIFALMNQGGVTLSAHDLRLALFSESARVHFVRLAGIYDCEEESCERMLEVGESKFGLAYPWNEPSLWLSWWQGSRFALGQAASEMFLFFLAGRFGEHIDHLLDSMRNQNHLHLRLSDSVSNTLDILCAQFEAEDKELDSVQRLPDLPKLDEYFREFEHWFNAIRSRNIAIRTRSSRKIALIIAAAAEYWGDPGRVSDAQWAQLEFLLTEGPRAISQRFGEYPSVRGKWPTQRRQIQRISEIVAVVAGGTPLSAATA